jgi:hypothetical protein
VKAEHGYSQKQKEGFRCGGKVKAIREAESEERKLTCVGNSVWLTAASKRFGNRDKIVSAAERNES